MIWLLTILILAASAQADVTRTRKTTTTFWGTNESTVSDYYAEDRSASESSVKWTRGFMKTMTRGKKEESVSIIRLDREVVWDLDPKKETYTEMTFAEFREKLEQSMAEMEDMAKENEEEEPDTLDEDAYEWTLEDESSGQPKTIRGWTCRNAKIVATGVHKEDPNDKVIITMDLWNSEEVPGAEEIAAFQARYLKAVGLDETALTPGLMQAVQLYQKQFEAVAEASRKAPGEPVQSLIEIRHNRPKGKSLGEAVEEGVANEVMKKLPFGRKAKPKNEEPVYEMKVVFSSDTELLKAARQTVEGTRFEIPAGYEREE